MQFVTNKAKQACVLLQLERSSDAFCADTAVTKSWIFVSPRPLTVTNALLIMLVNTRKLLDLYVGTGPNILQLATVLRPHRQCLRHVAAV